MPIAAYGCQNLGPGYRHDALVVIVDCFIAAHQFIVTDHAGNVFHTLKSIAPTVDNIALGQVDLLVVQFIPQDGLVFLGEDLGDSEDMFGIDAGNYHRSVSAQAARDRFHLDRGGYFLFLHKPLVEPGIIAIRQAAQRDLQSVALGMRAAKFRQSKGQ